MKLLVLAVAFLAACTQQNLSTETGALSADPRTICHNGQTIQIDGNAWRAHQAHGDPPRACEDRLLAVALAGAGAGTVSDGSATICPGACSEAYPVGQTATLTAVAAAGSAFVGWSGACSGTGACVIAMTDDSSVTATFAPAFTLTTAIAGTGSGAIVSGVDQLCPGACSLDLAAGTTLTLVPQPAPGSTFVGWSGACTGSSPCVVTMDTAKSVIATFDVPQFHSLVTNISFAGTGFIDGGPLGDLCSGCTRPVLDGTVVTLTAVSGVGYTFAGWSGACTGTGTCTFTMTADTTVFAAFISTGPTYVLTTAIGGPGTGAIFGGPAFGLMCPGPCTNTLPAGKVMTLSAFADPGWVFAGWSGACAGVTGNVCVLTMDAAKSVTASFGGPPQPHLLAL